MNSGEPNSKMTSLYVGDLHQDINEAELFAKFSTAGPVLSIRVCRDAITRRSLGYAYVNFQKAADAERALIEMKFDTIRNKPIRIMWCQRDPSLRRSGKGNVFIKNLDKSVDNKTLYNTFSAFGNILSCKVATDDEGNSKGYGFVHFETEESANTSIAKVNGIFLNNKKVYVEKFVPPKERVKELGEATKPFTNVYVKNFGKDVCEEKLKEMFEPFGKITRSKIMLNEDGKSKGYGFVEFERAEAAEAAVIALHGKVMKDNEILYVARVEKKAKQENIRKNSVEGANLYVKNLDDSIDDERLRNEFSAFGSITSAKVMTDKQGRSKGFGFVCFTSPDEAACAITHLNGRFVGSKPLYVAIAQHGKDRKLNLALQNVHQTTDIQRDQLRQMFHPAAGFFVVPVMPLCQYFFDPHVTQPICITTPLTHQVHPAAGADGVTQAGTGTAARGVFQNVAVAPNTHFLPPICGERDQLQEVHDASVAIAAGTMSNTGDCAVIGQNANIRNLPPKPVQAPLSTHPWYQKYQEKFNASSLHIAEPEDQQQVLGERLYPETERTHEKMAGKVTRVLLEAENTETLHILGDQ